MEWNDVGELSLDDSDDASATPVGTEYSELRSINAPSLDDSKLDLEPTLTQSPTIHIETQQSTIEERTILDSSSRPISGAAAEAVISTNEVKRERADFLETVSISRKVSSRRSHPDRVRDPPPRGAMSSVKPRRGSSAKIRSPADEVGPPASSNSISKVCSIIKHVDDCSVGSSNVSQEQSEENVRSDTKTPPSSTDALYARIEKLHNANKNLRGKLKEFSKLLDARLGHAQVMRIKARAPGTARIETSLEDSTVLRQELSNAQKQVVIYQRENARLLRSLDQSSSLEHLNELANRITDLTHQNKQLKSELSSLSAINRRTEKSQQQLEKYSASYPKQIRSLQSEIRALREKACVTSTTQRELEQSSIRDHSKIATLQEKLRAQAKGRDSDVSASAMKEMADMETRLVQMKQKLSDQNKKAFNQRAQFRRQLQKRDEKIEELEHRIEELLYAPRGVPVPSPKKRNTTRARPGRQKGAKQSSRERKDKHATRQVQESKARLDQLSKSLVPRASKYANSEHAHSNSDYAPSHIEQTPAGSQQETKDQKVGGDDKAMEDVEDSLMYTAASPEQHGESAYSSDSYTYSDAFESD